jgi:hypothetical protein
VKGFVCLILSCDKNRSDEAMRSDQGDEAMRSDQGDEATTDNFLLANIESLNRSIRYDMCIAPLYCSDSISIQYIGMVCIASM